MDILHLNLSNILISNSKSDYHENLSKELKELRESKVWQTAAIIRSLRLEKQKVHNRYF